MKSYSLTLFCLLLFAFQILLGQNKDLPSIHVKYTSEDIAIDGNADESSWSTAPESSDFWQWFPTDSIRALNQTRFKVLNDDKNIYLSIQTFYPGEDYVIPSLRRDFQGGGNDNIAFHFDPFNDRTNSFFFGTNPLGVKREALISNGGNDWRRDSNLSWDIKWETVTKQFDGFTLTEVKIPLAFLNYPDGSTNWGFNMYRFDTQANERSSWGHVPQNQSVVNLAFMGDLQFEKPLPKSKIPWAFIPFVAGINANDFENDERFRSLSFGGDIKVPINNGLNLDLTFNPDFSQVEVDDQVINLTRFEVRLPEKRQFFIQNADLFANYGSSYNAQPFFSRRIGVAEDKDGNTIQNRIVAGARLSGKVNNNLRLGLLNMQTDADEANEIAANNNTVFTLQQKVFSRSNVSFIFVNRETTGEYDFVDEDDRYNRVVGMDYRLASKDNKWTGNSYFHKSFEQNGGRDNVSWGGFINRNTRNYQISQSIAGIGEDFNADLGFVRRKGNFRNFTKYTQKFYPKTGAINTWNLTLQSYSLWKPSDDFRLTDNSLNLESQIRFKNQSRIDVEASNRNVYLYDAFDPTGLNDDNPLPGDTEYTYKSVEVTFDSDQRKRFNYRLRPSVGEFFDGQKYSLQSDFNYRIQPFFQASLKLNYDHIQLGQGFPSADLLLVSPKVDLTFTKSIFWTTFVQFSSQSENLGINSRLQWRFAPLSDLYVVYNDNYITTDSFLPRLRTFNLKFTYWLNI